MNKEFLLMLHPTFGVLGMLAAVWVLVEVINLSDTNRGRIKAASLAVAVLIWLSFIFGGYWYVQFYGADKEIIKQGPWPFAHSFFMETKEHLFFVMLLIGTYLPIAASGAVSGVASRNRLAVEPGARNLLLTLSALIVLLGLAMEGSGAIVGLGVKMGLLGN